MEGNTVLVFVPEEGVLKECKIKIGISNWKYSEVTDGVEEGEKVLLSVDKEGVEDGVAVKIDQEKSK